MKKNIIFLFSIILISLTSCDTLTRYTATISVARNPVLIIVNQTGYPADLSSPVTSQLNDGTSVQLQPTNPDINVIYRIGTMQFNEQVTVNSDTTISLTKRPPTITVVNQTGYTAALTAPVTMNIDNGSNAHFFAPAVNQVVGIQYQIGPMSFTEQVTMGDQDVNVNLTKRPPVITVTNQTGYQVTLTAPVTVNIDSGKNNNFFSPAINQVIPIQYQIGMMNFTEPVTLANQDVNVNLTRRPPTITLINNVGETINTLFLRIPNAPAWTGGNIVIRGGIANITAAGTAQATDISGSIINGDRMQIFMGNVPIGGDRFDVRIDDVKGNSYVKKNVQITGDISLTFSPSDRS